ncbi:MAG: preprotein translocase subunit SecE [Planctomycetota bacterium]
MSNADLAPSKSTPPAKAEGGLLTPYKRGQGFWTRLGTGLGAGLVILFTIRFLYQRLPSITGLPQGDWRLLAALAGLALVLVVVTWLLMNRPKHAEFLINTDGEMKKVKWSTWRELVGNTKVVIGFMFLVAALLFSYDVVFSTAMWWIDVLKVDPPFFFGGE